MFLFGLLYLHWGLFVKQVNCAENSDGWLFCRQLLVYVPIVYDCPFVGIYCGCFQGYTEATLLFESFHRARLGAGLWERAHFCSVSVVVIPCGIEAWLP